MINPLNTHASPTPAVGEQRVYVHYGPLGTAALSKHGRPLWSKKLKYESLHGAGGSPVLFKDLLIVSCDGTDRRFIVALDTATGEVRWQKERNGQRAYSTPLMVTVAGVPQVVIPCGKGLFAYNASSGQEVWSLTRSPQFSQPVPSSASLRATTCRERRKLRWPLSATLCTCAQIWRSIAFAHRQGGQEAGRQGRWPGRRRIPVSLRFRRPRNRVVCRQSRA